MKIRKVVLVVFMLSFLMSYSDAGFLCDREKNEIYQCRAERTNANTNCQTALTNANANCQTTLANANANCQTTLANANANCNAKLMKINAEKEEKMKENTKCNDTLTFWKGMGIGGAVVAVCIELVHKLLR